MRLVNLKYQLILTFTVLLVTLIFWTAFYSNLPSKIGFPNVSLETVFANYDGPNYMVISKCGYDKNCIGPNFSLPQPLEYYPAHLPGYPILITALSFFTTGPKAMLFATLLGSVLMTLLFFQLLKLFVKDNEAFWLSLIFIFFPARLFVLRMIGAPETWFMSSILASVYLFKKENYFWAAVMAAVSQLFKSPGVLLFGAYGLLALVELIRTRNLVFILKKYISFALVPLTALGIFYYYKTETGDFWAYFHSGDNFHLNQLPYLVFISTKSWINTIWLEDVIYLYLIAIYGTYLLYKNYKNDIVAVFPIVFTAATLFVAHRDISRYIAPVYPFLFISYKDLLLKPQFRIIFLLLIPAIILYAINFVVGNTAPIANWAPYL